MAHLSGDELRIVIQAAEQQVPTGSLRSHRKSPQKTYVIHDIIIAEADDGVLIIYESTDASLHGIRFARPISSFLEIVETPQGKYIPRFKRIS